MGDNHTVYERPEGQTTQWEDIQRKMGNMAPAEKVWKPAAWSAKRELPKGLAALVGGNGSGSGGADAVDDLEGEFDDDRFLEEYRLKRLAELREKEEKAAAVGKRGHVATISKEEYVSKVTRASAGVDPDDAVFAPAATANEEEDDDEEEDNNLSGPKPTGPARWVVCHMFREGAAGCDDVDDALRQLADSPAAAAPAAAASSAAPPSSSSSSSSSRGAIMKKQFPRVSFVRIRADDVAPGYPASALPTLPAAAAAAEVAAAAGKKTPPAKRRKRGLLTRGRRGTSGGSRPRRSWRRSRRRRRGS